MADEAYAPISEWADDASTPTLKNTFYKRELYGDGPYEDQVRAMSGSSLEREYFLKILLDNAYFGRVPSGGQSGQALMQIGEVYGWKYLNKTDVGLSNVDNTSDSNKPVSTAQADAIRDYGKYLNGEKLPTDSPTTYPTAVSTVLGRVSDGWPQLGKSATYTQITTTRSANNWGGVLQMATAHSDKEAPVKYRVSSGDNSWGNWKTLAVTEGAKITFGNEALSSLPDSYSMTPNATIVSLGYRAHANMQEVRQSIAIGSGAMSQGTKSRDNIAIGDDAGWATESASALYVQENRGGTRNVMMGGAAGRFNKTGIGHVLIGRGAGASIVSGNGAVVIGSNANAGSQPIGLSGEIENWGNFFAGDPEARTRFVAVGCEAAWANSGVSTTAIGNRALFNHTKGDYNSALGDGALESLSSNTWLNGGVYRSQVKKTGTYTHSGNTLILTITAHGAQVGDIVRLRLLTGPSATFMSDRAYATALSVTTNTITFNHPLANSSSGDAEIDAVISGTLGTLNHWNSAFGSKSLNSLVTGSGNSSFGHESGRDLSNGSYNLFQGYGAGRFLTSGSGNAIFGYLSGNQWVDGTNMENASGVVTVGQYARASANNQMQLGSSAVTTYAFGAVQDRSDIRDKADVKDTELGLEFINKLRPVDFKWDYRDDYIEYDEDDNPIKLNKDGSKKRERFHHGLIAQEVQEVISETGIDFGGFQDHSINGGNDVLSIGYTELIAPLIKAVQELSAEVKELKNRV